MDKERVRLKMLRLRRDMPAKERKEKGNAIILRCQEHPDYKIAKTIMLYCSKDEEVNTRPLIVQALLDSKRVLLPRVDLARKEMEAREIRSIYELEDGAFGILEPPSTANRVDFWDIDLVFVPGLAFDVYGNRIGYGKGYYDKALPKMEKAERIGLCYDAQFLDEPIEVGKHDEPVDEILTERRRIIAAKKPRPAAPARPLFAEESEKEGRDKQREALEKLAAQEKAKEQKK